MSSAMKSSNQTQYGLPSFQVIGLLPQLRHGLDLHVVDGAYNPFLDGPRL
jgi:hypothetical protein